MSVQCRPNACAVQTDSGSAELGCVCSAELGCVSSTELGCVCENGRSCWRVRCSGRVGVAG